MATQNHFLASLSYIDQRLDELNEEFGELPRLEKDKQHELALAKLQLEETQNVIDELQKFLSTAKVTLIELKDKEENLAKKQFLVRNNKEFDALSKEIEQLKQEHNDLSTRYRNEGIKEENLMRILEEQRSKYERLKTELLNIRKNIEELAGEQKEEVRSLNEQKEQIVNHLHTYNYKEYNRIRKNFSDAATQIVRGRCSGCFNTITPQKIVEVRNNKDTLYLCDHCGRILLSDDLEINEDLVDELLNEKI
ncbi:MAG TPA: C4-type zinc ribbon domain-containing protein [Candidatus Kapabacteria bacterium]|jgi:predicted  nucleic acid-binding Zn-ribbon protein|nr:hypothetical protein [Candidatus Kapabacteria bacterium]HOV92018.1 C4-type zinc ribbon domain-containing protein [Candidatus Kapabacteria bacterium]